MFYELKNLNRVPAIGEIGASTSKDEGKTWQCKFLGMIGTPKVL